MFAQNIFGLVGFNFVYPILEEIIAKQELKHRRLQNHRANLNKSWHTTFMEEGNSICFK